MRSFAAASMAAGRLSAPASSTRRCSAKAAAITARRSGPAAAPAAPAPAAPAPAAGAPPVVPAGPPELPGCGVVDGRAGFTPAVYLMVAGRPNQDVRRGPARVGSGRAAPRMWDSREQRWIAGRLRAPPTA